MKSRGKVAMSLNKNRDQHTKGKYLSSSSEMLLKNHSLFLTKMATHSKRQRQKDQMWESLLD
jgi:hypothetical protein